MPDIEDYREILPENYLGKAQFQIDQQDRLTSALLEVSRTISAAVESSANASRAGQQEVAASVNALRNEVSSLSAALTEQITALTRKIEAMYEDSKAFPAEEYTAQNAGPAWDGTLQHHELDVPLSVEEYTK